MSSSHVILIITRHHHPPHHAPPALHRQVARLLLAAEADRGLGGGRGRDSTNPQGRTALWLAAKKGRTQVRAWPECSSVRGY
jgi:hypothetical protein